MFAAVITETAVSITIPAGLRHVSTVLHAVIWKSADISVSVGKVSTGPAANTSTAVPHHRVSTAVYAPTLQTPEVISAHARPDMSARRAASTIHAVMAALGHSVYSMAAYVPQCPAPEVRSCTPVPVRRASMEPIALISIRALRLPV